MASQTARQVITRAMRRLRIIASEETMSAAELSDALTTMNGVMFGFGPRGINYAHVDLTADDVVNMPDEQIDNLIWLIAESLAPEYGKQFQPTELAAVQNARLELQAAYKNIPPAVSPRGLLRNLPGRFFSMERGE